MPLITPSVRVPIADSTGRPTSEWGKFFAQLTAEPAPAVSVTPSGSPFAYTAPDWGNILISGGSISAISITRGGVTIPTGLTSGFVPLGKGDTVSVTYTVAPSMTWLPS